MLWYLYLQISDKCVWKIQGADKKSYTNGSWTTMRNAKFQEMLFSFENSCCQNVCLWHFVNPVSILQQQRRHKNDMEQKKNIKEQKSQWNAIKEHCFLFWTNHCKIFLFWMLCQNNYIVFKCFKGQCEHSQYMFQNTHMYVAGVLELIQNVKYFSLVFVYFLHWKKDPRVVKYGFV